MFWRGGGVGGWWVLVGYLAFYKVWRYEMRFMIGYQGGRYGILFVREQEDGERLLCCGVGALMSLLLFF